MREINKCEQWHTHTEGEKERGGGKGKGGMKLGIANILKK